MRPVAADTIERCIEPSCDRERAEEGLRCVLHASRLGQTQNLPLGFRPESHQPVREIIPAPRRGPAIVAAEQPTAPTSSRTLTVLGYAAIAAGWSGIGMLFFDAVVPGAILSVGGHAAALGFAIAAAVRRTKPKLDV